MHRFAIAHESGGDWAGLAKSCADGLLAAGADGNLGFLYATDMLAEDLPSILTFLRERTKIADWVGTVGLGICATGREYYDQPALAVMTARFADGAYRLFPPLSNEEDLARAREESWFEGIAPGLGIVHGDPRNPHTPELVHALAGEHSFYLVGGLSASRAAFSQISGNVVEGGLSGVALSHQVPVAVGLTQGCAPVGPPRSVTGQEGHVVLELDGRPAFEVLCEDAECEADGDLAEALGDIHVALPVPGSDTGDYVVRNLTEVGPEDGWIAIGDFVSKGASLMFCRRDADSAERDLVRMLADLQRRAGGPPQAGLYFSCVGRGPNLFGDNSDELGVIREVLGDFPLVGFFGNGEISNDRLYGYTGVLTLFL